MADQGDAYEGDKPKYENKPMPPPGGPYLGVVVSEGTKRTGTGTLKKWVKVQTRLDGQVYEAFLDIYATERSARTYLKVWCHAFDIPIGPSTATDIFSGKQKHKACPVAYDVIASDKPKADGSPYYKAVHPRKFGEPAPEFTKTAGAVGALTPEEADRLNRGLVKETSGQRIQRQKGPAAAPQIQPAEWEPAKQIIPPPQITGPALAKPPVNFFSE